MQNVLKSVTLKRKFGEREGVVGGRLAGSQGSSSKSPANSSQRPVGRPRGASECGTFCLPFGIRAVVCGQREGQER